MPVPVTDSLLASLYIFNATASLKSYISASPIFANFRIFFESFSQFVSPEVITNLSAYALVFDPRLFSEVTSEEFLDSGLRAVITSMHRTCLISSNHFSSTELLTNDLRNSKHLQILLLHHPGNVDLVPKASPINRLIAGLQSNEGLAESAAKSLSTPLLIEDALSMSLKLLLGYPISPNIHLVTGNQAVTWEKLNQLGGGKLSKLGFNPNSFRSIIPQDLALALPSTFSMSYWYPLPETTPTSLPVKKVVKPSFLTKKNFSLSIAVVITLLLLCALIFLSPLIYLTSSIKLVEKGFLTSRLNYQITSFINPILKHEASFLSMFYPHTNQRILNLIDHNLSSSFSSSHVDELSQNLTNLSSYALGGRSISDVTSELDQAITHTQILRQATTGRTILQPEFLRHITTIEGVLLIFQDMIKLQDTSLAIVLVNNAELRSTGGLIQAIGLATISQGKLGAVGWYQPSFLDQKTNGQVVPPADLADNLRTNTWYIRDATWDLSTQESNAKINWFLDKQLQISPDYTLVITTEALKSLLKSQSVRVGESTIDAGNLYQLLAAEATNPLPENALPLFAQTVDSYIKKVSLNSPESTHDLQNAFITSLIHKNIYFTTKIPSISALVSRYQLDGELPLVSCDEKVKNCSPDIIYAVDSNISINQVNPYIKSTHTYDLHLGSGHNTHSYKLMSENHSPSSAYPYGSYQSYLRFAIPSNAEGIQIQADGKKIDTQNWYVETKAGYKIIGVKRHIPIGQSHQLQINFVTPSSTNHQYYDLVIIDQPGNGDPLLKFTLTSDAPIKNVYVNGNLTQAQYLELPLEGNQTLKVAF